MATVAETDPNLASITNVNHIAYRCRDAEQTRWFYEDVLGLPLKIAFAEESIPGTGEASPFMHLFFQLPNGDFVAFFDNPSKATSDSFDPADSFDRHLAFEVPSREDLIARQKEINANGVMCLGPIDHGFVQSCYMYDPNGLQVEITCKTDTFEEHLKPKDARAALDEWVQRTRAEKEEKFGAEALDNRQILYPMG